MPIGPRGEKRPVSVVQNAVHVMKVATGIAEEEYVDGRPWTDEEVMAMRMADATPKKRKKGKKSRNR